MVNTIVALNTPDNCSGAGVTSNGHNLDDHGTCNLSGTGDLSDTAANLGSLQNNGGPTLTHALLSGSPAIDAGDNTVCTSTYSPQSPAGALWSIRPTRLGLRPQRRRATL